MKTREFVLGALAYALVVFPLAYAWHLVLFRTIYDEIGAYGREEPIVPLGFASIVIQGLLLSGAYSRVRPRGGHLASPLRFSLLAGLFLWTSQVVAEAAKQPIAPLATWFGLETAYFLLQFSLFGVALGLVHASRDRAAEPSAG